MLEQTNNHKSYNEYTEKNKLSCFDRSILRCIQALICNEWLDGSNL